MTPRDIDALLTDLLAEPPEPRALKQQVKRLSPSDRNMLRKAVVQRLDAPTTPSAFEVAILDALLNTLGTKPALSALERLAKNPKRDVDVRRVAAAYLIAAGRPDALGGLSPEDVDSLTRAGLRASVESAPDPGALLSSIAEMEGSPPGMLAAMIGVADGVRRESGHTFGAYFERLISRARHRRRPLPPDATSALVAAAHGESDPDTQALLVTLRDGSPDADSRRAAQRAVLSVGTAYTEPRPAPREAPPGAAGYLGSADGAGALMVLATLPNRDGTCTLVNLCFRLIGDIRDAFILTRQRPRDVAHLIEQCARTTLFSGTTLEHIADLCAAAARRTHLIGLEPPPDAKPALRLLAPFAQGLPVLGAAPAAAVTLAAVRSLLERPQYGSWFFDVGDIAGLGLDPASNLAAPRRIAETLRRFGASIVAHRVVALARHQATWHALRGEDAEAALMAACAEQAEADFSRSVLARVMVENGVAMVERGAPLPRVAAVQDMVGASGRRSFLRDRFFPGQRPRGARDLARLDFATALDGVMKVAHLNMIGELEPSEPRLLAFIDRLATAAADHLLRVGPDGFQATSVLDAVRPQIDMLYSEAAPRTREDIAANLMGTLTTHGTGFCRDCEVACFANPGRGYGDEIEDPTHPIIAGEVRRRQGPPAR